MASQLIHAKLGFHRLLAVLPCLGVMGLDHLYDEVCGDKCTETANQSGNPFPLRNFSTVNCQRPRPITGCQYCLVIGDGSIERGAGPVGCRVLSLSCSCKVSPALGIKTGQQHPQDWAYCKAGSSRLRPKSSLSLTANMLATLSMKS